MTALILAKTQKGIQKSKITLEKLSPVTEQLILRLQALNAYEAAEVLLCLSGFASSAPGASRLDLSSLRCTFRVRNIYRDVRGLIFLPKLLGQ